MSSKPKETIEDLVAQRNKLWTKTGQHQFTEAVIKAELLQLNQQILDINNKLQVLFKEAEKSHQEATGVAPEVLPMNENIPVPELAVENVSPA